MSKEKKEKKEKRSKKEKKSKKRKRDDSSSEDDRHGNRHLEDVANKISKALRKDTEEAYADDQGQLQIGGKFVWKKKIVQDLQSGARKEDIYERERRNTQAEREADIEKVKRRREEREREKEEREKENEQLQRDRAAFEALEMEEKEEEFHLDNAKARSEHRLRQNRAHPIDYLVRDLLLIDVMDIGDAPPYEVFKDLTLSDVKELRDDVLEYQELDKSDKLHKAWWDALLFLCNEELREAEARRLDDKANLKKDSLDFEPRTRNVGINSAVEADIEDYLAGQSISDLTSLEVELKEQLQSGTATDPEWTSAVVKRMGPHKARAELRDLHSMLKARQTVNGKGVAKQAHKSGWRDEYVKVAHNNGDQEPHESSDEDGAGEQLPPPIIPNNTEAIEEAQHTGQGQWSPDPLEPEEYTGADVVSAEDDQRERQRLRQQALQASAASFETVALMPAHGSGDFSAAANSQARQGAPAQVDDAETRRFKAQAAKAMGTLDDAGDAPFGGEIQMESKVYWWHEKYRPRKPKYYNRVHTGYEWNKYNQTHYDHDNPPPKVVQGYKFNVFYPDLIDRKVAPEYSVEPDPEADQFGSTCILRFHAGPPYEDLTFRILNREWEYSHKKGYKCVYDRDTLYLYFNFKRQRYRR